MPPRPIRPKSESLASEGNDAGEGKGGKRRAVSSACIPCRKRKSKVSIFDPGSTAIPLKSVDSVMETSHRVLLA